MGRSQVVQLFGEDHVLRLAVPVDEVQVRARFDRQGGPQDAHHGDDPAAGREGVVGAAVPWDDPDPEVPCGGLHPDHLPGFGPLHQVGRDQPSGQALDGYRRLVPEFGGRTERVHPPVLLPFDGDPDYHVLARLSSHPAALGRGT